MGIDHAWEIFSSAVRSAIVSDASLQDRLDRLINDVCHLQRDSFPDEHAWDEFRKLMNETTKREGRQGEPGTHAVISQMSDEKSRKCLQTALDIYSQIARAF